MRGGQWQALRLIEGLATEGVESTLLAPAGSPLFEAARRGGWRVENIGLLRTLTCAMKHDLLHAHDCRTLNELCEHLDMTRQGVTQHLDVLEAANLVATVRRGREKLHFLNPVPLQEIYERWIAKFEKPRLKALSKLKKRLEKENG